ncbi:pyridoxamine 5'-phosphate oxidase [Phenylobacterium deserti]|uniref:Pyridoxamine 5'-phosphate oxidase n=2 Tax=Phenylobacterium deserti TaxID=1914756 RepID=A0A328AAR8_9CAUL|nr:pyridoxamine 5'-phosphate oxidase [Phenylobacterium deserti]
MADMTLQDLSQKMRDIDFTTVFTRTEGGALAGRPMSNNGEVEYEGDSYFFAWDDSRVAGDIARDPQVGMSLQGSKGLLGKPPLFITIEGRAELIRDKAQFQEHWTKDLDRWFENGPDTPGVVMIKVRAERIHYWDGGDEGEIPVA